MNSIRVDEIIDGTAPLPLAPDQRDVLTFVIQAIRAQLVKELPPTRANLTPAMRERLHHVRRLIAELARTDEELAVLLLATEQGDDARNYPAWFLAEVAGSLGKLAERFGTQDIVITVP